MIRETGNKKFKIWLLGDSEPENWQKILKTPFDSRHPIRHNIWTSIIDLIQDNLFRNCIKRIDTNQIFIRNAVDNPNKKPENNEIKWNDKQDLLNEINDYKELINQYKPCFIFTFGSFSYEFARRCLDEKEIYNYKYWNTKKLGEDFRNRIINFKVDKINIIPLLHRSISGGKFIESHNYFCNKNGANYFEYVSKEITEKIINNKDNLNNIFI